MEDSEVEEVNEAPYSLTVTNIEAVVEEEEEVTDFEGFDNFELDLEAAEEARRSNPHQPRSRAPRGGYQARLRHHGELRGEVGEGDCDLTHLWEPSNRDRDHLPPPEHLYESFEEALTAVTTWAKDHGVAYNQNRWYQNPQKLRQRLLMVCSKRGKPKQTSAVRKRPGAGSSRCGCRMQFYLLANDYRDLEGQWRVKWSENKRSYTHNHPPVEDLYAMPRYRRATRTAAMIERLQQVFEMARGSKQALVMIREAYPDAVFSRQDVVNEYRQYQRQQLGNRTRTDALVEELEGGRYWYR